MNSFISFGRKVKFSILKSLGRLCYAWAYIPFLSDVWTRVSLTKSPVLVVSVPRSGSSWIGARLALSSKAAYLREPINSSYLSSGGHNTLKMISTDFPDTLFYDLSDKAFLRAPRFGDAVVSYPHQWLPWNLFGRRRLLKEVNPLALDYWINRFSPLIVFIVRHPAAIAASYMELGWLENDDIRDISSTEGMTPFEVFGLRIGEVYDYVFSVLKNYSTKHIVVRYESLVEDEASELMRISTFTKLPLTLPRIAQELERGVKDYRSFKQNPFSLNRRNTDQKNKWRRKLNNTQISEIRSGYLRFSCPFYTEDIDW
jgi:hypothetical protein